MCLILFALNKHPEYKFILAANRDEFFNRPTSKADYWSENKHILGGRDELSKGTWLGVTENGRFIAITNYRDPGSESDNKQSRGEISKDFLVSDMNVHSFISRLSNEKKLYNGFNILLSDNGFDSVFHYSNISDKTTNISDGYHGLSNHLLDTNWPKVRIGKKELSKVIESGSIDVHELIVLLKDEVVAPDDALPSTGISYDLEKKLSPVFISMKGYGTRCSSALLIDKNNHLSFLEVSYDENKVVLAEQAFNMNLKS